jgi:hypothetical protein
MWLMDLVLWGKSYSNFTINVALGFDVYIFKKLRFFCNIIKFFCAFVGAGDIAIGIAILIVYYRVVVYGSGRSFKRLTKVIKKFKNASVFVYNLLYY